MDKPENKQRTTEIEAMKHLRTKHPSANITLRLKFDAPKFKLALRKAILEAMQQVMKDVVAKFVTVESADTGRTQ